MKATLLDEQMRVFLFWSVAFPSAAAEWGGPRGVLIMKRIPVPPPPHRSGASPVFLMHDEISIITRPIYAPILKCMM